MGVPDTYWDLKLLDSDFMSRLICSQFAFLYMGIMRDLCVFSLLDESLAQR